MTTSHCLNHNLPTVTKIEATHNELVLPEGTVFCVKGGVYNSGVLKADGETNLYTYLGVDKDVSYYVIYPQQPPTPESTTTTTTTEPTTTTTTVPVATTTTVEPTTPHVVCETPSGYTYKIGEGLECLPPEYDLPEATTTEQPLGPVPLTELPHTGLQGAMVALALVLLISGLCAITIGKLIAGGRGR